MFDNIKNSERVLILAPLGRDAALTCDILSSNGLSCHVSTDIKDLVLEAQRGAAAILVTEEVFTPEAVDALNGVLDQQPDWSDLPVLVLVSGKPERNKKQNIINALGPGRHISILERPTSASSLVAVLHSAVKSRERQYQVSILLRKLELTAARLEESNQALQDFASIASHDMQEPLRKVISFGNMLRQKHKDSLGDNGNDYLNRMLDATKRMQSLLTSLLDYSRVTVNPEPFKEVDLFDIIHEVLSDLEVRIQKSGGEVRVEKLPTIEADPTQMRQLFQNLIGNALKFHKVGKKPIVKVRSLQTANPVCQIVVEDNGIGFDGKCGERIFAPFQRLCGRSEYEGTGIGLAICKKIVERHGGSITAKSTPGTGSTFILTLPVSQRGGGGAIYPMTRQRKGSGPMPLT